jgi:adenylate cyclase
MNSRLRSKRLLAFVGLSTTGVLVVVSLFLLGLGTVWTDYDFKVLDPFFQKAVKLGRGPKQSSRIVLIAITDKTYEYFGKSILDRKDLADVNNALAKLGVGAVGYDVIFARPSRSEADQAFAESISRLGSVYLPMGFEYTDKVAPFRWEEGPSYGRLRSDYLRKPIESGKAHPYYATKALMQSDRFSEVAFNSGHVSAYSDPDGIYRHVIMLLKIGDAYVPALSLSMFLNHVKVPIEKMVVEWGRRIVIPATRDSLLERDLIIPIDERGRAFIPYPQVWDQAFKKMEAQTLLKYMADENLRGNLTEFFEGRLALIGDISVGTSDLGQTPLDENVPLFFMHAAMLNGMLTDTFYDKWSFKNVLIIVWGLGAVLALSAAPRYSWIFYGTGAAMAAGLAGFTWFQFTHYHLFPIVTVGGSVMACFFGILTTLVVALGKERSFIKNAFARYLPETVIDNLVANPEQLKLGGEEKVISVLFSDLAGFTSISESMPPSDLVRLLNEYLTEMTDIVLAQGGIIDKFEGDAVMAEFGAPLSMPDHADRAVNAGLLMQRRLKELRQVWREKGLPELHCRVGINTGTVIVGNMGSNRVFDYTVIGDAVNLASRLEGANKMYNTLVMISEFTHTHLSPGKFRTRVLDVIKVKGKSKAVKVFEVCGASEEPLDPREEDYYRLYEEAFDLYLCRKLDAARLKFQEALLLRADDSAAKEMIARIDGLNASSLPQDWDGSIALISK